MENNQHERLHILLDKYIKNLCSDEELDELFDYISMQDADDIHGQHILETLQSPVRGGANLEAYKSEKIVGKIFASQEENTAIIRRISRGKRFIIRRVVAAVIIAVMLTTALLVFDRVNRSPFRETTLSAKENQRTENGTSKAMQVQLEDGSRVTLQPGAALTFPRHFDTQKREVVLEGEAFFDIARNPERPFLVYHEHLVTRVLGTSFYIRYNKDHKEVEVEVSSGKVEVYENVKKKDSRSHSNGVIITPNQKVIYAEDKRLFSTLLADNPQPIMVKDEQGGIIAPGHALYEFDKAPMSAIIELLNKSYGIEIEVETDNLKNCLFTGDIADQDLYSKLSILCEAIGAKYEVKGTRILIKGKGCK